MNKRNAQNGHEPTDNPALRQDVLLRSFNSLVQTARIHDDNYTFLQDTAKEFINSVAAYCEEDDHCSLQASRGRLYLQEEKIPFRSQNKNLLENMMSFFKKRQLPGLRFQPDISNIGYTDLLTFIRHLDHAVQEEDPVEWLSLEIDGYAKPWVEVIGHTEELGEEGGEDSTDEQGMDDRQNRIERARRDYSYVLSSFKEIAKKLSADKRAGIRRSVRMTQKMVDHILEDEDIFTAISTIRIYDDYTFTHSVNVAILAITIGKRIGLNKTALERLGLCGIFHDLGKTVLPREILHKPGKLNDEEFKSLEKHSLDSARLIVRLRASADRKAQMLLPPFEHHLRYDLSGYPHIGWRNPISLYGRIITIADVYDAITSPRVYRPYAISPDRALGYMLSKSGIDFDPVLLKVFINIMGVYPVGTLIKLDTNELCLVMESAENSEDARPLATLLIYEDEGKYRKGDTINLAERDPQTGRYLKNIVDTLHPSILSIQPAEYIT
jgi:HD-GYP domain-containing protein (c-di-GMP phosphodiesterase class II)